MKFKPSLDKLNSVWSFNIRLKEKIIASPCRIVLFIDRTSFTLSTQLNIDKKVTK
jgi:hypothetical protein